MKPRKTPETTQMNLLFCDSKPMMLPDDKQRELAIALADLLLNAATEPNSEASTWLRPKLRRCDATSLAGDFPFT